LLAFVNFTLRSSGGLLQRPATAAEGTFRMDSRLRDSLRGALAASFGLAIILAPAIAGADPADPDSSSQPAENPGDAQTSDPRVGSAPNSPAGDAPGEDVDSATESYSDLAESEARAWQESEDRTSREAAEAIQQESESLAERLAASEAEREKSPDGLLQQSIAEHLTLEQGALDAERQLAVDTLVWQQRAAIDEAAVFAAIQRKQVDQLGSITTQSKATHQELIADHALQLQKFSGVAQLTDSAGSITAGLWDGHGIMIELAAKEEQAVSGLDAAMGQGGAAEQEFINNMVDVMADVRKTMEEIMHSQTEALRTILRT
jgi:hypothetical protein